MAFQNDKTIFKGSTTVDIQKRIIEQRKNNGMSQDDLAAMLNMPRSTYAYHEKRATELSVQFVHQVASALNVPYDYLCTGIMKIEEPTPPPVNPIDFPVTNGERKIIEKYRCIPLEARKEIRDLIDELYSKHKIKL